MSLQNRKARPVPLEQYEDYGDIPPEGMDRKRPANSPSELQL